ncbi:MAG: TIM barrel protein [Opitutaceae bacterium]
MRIRQSFCYPLFTRPDRSTAELFRHAREIGYVATEFWGRGPEHDGIVAEAKAAGLEIACMCGHASLTDGLNKASNHDRIEAELRENIAFAEKHGIRNLICFSGNRNPGQDDAAGMNVCAEGLQRAAPVAERAGVTLVVELLNSRVDHAGYQCDHTAWGVELCRKVGSPAVKLLYDIYHMQIMEGDLIRTIRDNIEHIGHFHTAGNPGRHEMDATQELNYAAICSAIAGTGFDGYLAHEFISTGDRWAGLQAAFTICDQG